MGRVLSQDLNRTSITPVDPAGPDCYRMEIKPCKSHVAIRGGRLSNT